MLPPLPVEAMDRQNRAGSEARSDFPHTPHLRLTRVSLDSYGGDGAFSANYGA